MHTSTSSGHFTNIRDFDDLQGRLEQAISKGLPVDFAVVVKWVEGGRLRTMENLMAIHHAARDGQEAARRQNDSQMVKGFRNIILATWSAGEESQHGFSIVCNCDWAESRREMAKIGIPRSEKTKLGIT